MCASILIQGWHGYTEAWPSEVESLQLVSPSNCSDGASSTSTQVSYQFLSYALSHAFNHAKFQENGATFQEHVDRSGMVVSFVMIIHNISLADLQSVYALVCLIICLVGVTVRHTIKVMHMFERTFLLLWPCRYTMYWPTRLQRIMLHDFSMTSEFRCRVNVYTQPADGVDGTPHPIVCFRWDL